MTLNPPSGHRRDCDYCPWSTGEQPDAAQADTELHEHVHQYHHRAAVLDQLVAEHDNRTADGRINVGPGGSLDIDNLFTYHPPHGDQVDRYAAIREVGGHFADVLSRLVPGCPERSTALAKIRETVMWANAGIACNEPAPPPEDLPRERFTDRGEVDACDAYDSQFITMPDGGLIDPRLLALLRDAGDEWGPTGVANVAQQLLAHERGAVEPPPDQLTPEQLDELPTLDVWGHRRIYLRGDLTPYNEAGERMHRAPSTELADAIKHVAGMDFNEVAVPYQPDSPHAASSVKPMDDPYATVSTAEPATVHIACARCDWWADTASTSEAEHAHAQHMRERHAPTPMPDPDARITVTEQPPTPQHVPMSVRVCMITHEPPWCDGPCQYATPREATPAELQPPTIGQAVVQFGNDVPPDSVVIGTITRPTDEQLAGARAQCDREPDPQAAHAALDAYLDAVNAASEFGGIEVVAARIDTEQP